MSPESPSPIFIHSLWRAGSTYLFQVFRRSEAGYYCYQEPLHEIVLDNQNSPENMLIIKSENVLDLRHPTLTYPYYQELCDVYEFWKEYICKQIIYDEYFVDCSIQLTSYFKTLLIHSKARPVIQECRTSHRIGSLKHVLGGIHLFLWRNPWDQWWSFKSTWYFDVVVQLLINAPIVPPVISALREKLGFQEFHSEDIHEEIEHFNTMRGSAEGSYLAFYILWCLAFLEAQQYADLQISIDHLSESDEYRMKILQALHELGIPGLDVADCSIHFTRFTVKDAAFFKPLEEQAHRLLIAHGTTLEQISVLEALRKQYLPTLQYELPTQIVRDMLLEDAVRTREVVIRLETAFHNNTQQQLMVQKQLEQQLEQQHSGLQRQYDERESLVTLQYADEKQSLNNLLKKYQEKAQSEAQLRIEQVAALDKQHNQEITELQKVNKQESDKLVHNYTIQLETLQQRYSALERELLQKQLVAQALSPHCENEFNQRLQALHQLANQEKQELSQQFTEQLLMAEQQYAAREKELLQEQLAMQVRSTEREREFNEELESLYRLADQEKQELSQKFTEQLLTAEQQYAAREKELLQEQLAMQVRSTEREREFNEQLESLYRLADQEKQELSQKYAAIFAATEQEKNKLVQHHAAQIDQQQQNFSKNLYLQLEQLELLKQANSAFEAELREQLYAQQQLCRQFEQSYTMLKAEVNAIYTSLSWCLTAPFRKITSLFRSNRKKLSTVNLSKIKPQVEIKHPYTQFEQSIESGQINIHDEDVFMPAIYDHKIILPVAKTVDDLLSYCDEQFIRCIYLTLLEREPDKEGMRYYLGRLRAGQAKTKIITQLASSSESQARGVDLPGLKQLIITQKKADHWFWGIFYSVKRQELQRNRIEYSVENVSSRLHGLEANIVSLSCSIDELKKKIAVTLGTQCLGTQQDIERDAISIEKEQHTLNLKLKELTPSTRKIYTKLLEAQSNVEE